LSCMGDSNCNDLDGPNAPVYRAYARVEERALVNTPLLFVP